jgi:hypothetical protein
VTGDGEELLESVADRLDAAAHARAEAELEPCFADDCPCCAAWTAALEKLRYSIARHTAGELRVAPCHAECLVCAQVDWQSKRTPLWTP